MLSWAHPANICVSDLLNKETDHGLGAHTPLRKFPLKQNLMQFSINCLKLLLLYSISVAFNIISLIVLESMYCISILVFFFFPEVFLLYLNAKPV